MRDEPVIGTRWQLRGEGTPWRVVSFKDGCVSLTGPGTCRGMKYVEDWEFYADWCRVDGADKP